MINLEKIRPTVATAILLCVCPFLIILLLFYLTRRQEFISMDFVRLVGISLALSGPAVIVCAIMDAISDLFTKNNSENTKEQRDEEEIRFYIGAGVFTTILYAFSILFVYLGGGQFRGVL